MSIIRNGNVTLCRPVDFKKRLCGMSLSPKKGHVALSILGVYTHQGQGVKSLNKFINPSLMILILNWLATSLM